MIPSSESNISKRVMLAVSRLGAKIFRNSVGFDRERKVRYGLAKGSHDLIGWYPIVIKPEHVGMTLAVFVGIEVKGEKTPLKKHQLNFMQVLADDGGISILARGSADDIERAFNEISEGLQAARGRHIRGTLSHTQRRKRENPEPDDKGVS